MGPVRQLMGWAKTDLVQVVLPLCKLQQGNQDSERWLLQKHFYSALTSGDEYKERLLVCTILVDIHAMGLLSVSNFVAVYWGGWSVLLSDVLLTMRFEFTRHSSRAECLLQYDTTLTPMDADYSALAKRQYCHIAVRCQYPSESSNVFGKPRPTSTINHASHRREHYYKCRLLACTSCSARSISLQQHFLDHTASGATAPRS